VYEVGPFAGKLLTVEIREAAEGRGRAAASVALHSDELKNTLHFTGRRSITAVSHADVAEHLRPVVKRAAAAPRRLASPDMVRMLCGAAMAGMRGLLTRARSGGRGCSLRLARIPGPRTWPIMSRGGTQPGRRREPGAVRALEGICSSPGNLISRLDRILSHRDETGAARAGASRIEEDTVELRFYIELLRRYAEDCARDRASATREWHDAPPRPPGPTALQEVDRMMSARPRATPRAPSEHPAGDPTPAERAD